MEEWNAHWTDMWCPVTRKPYRPSLGETLLDSQTCSQGFENFVRVKRNTNQRSSEAMCLTCQWIEDQSFLALMIYNVSTRWNVSLAQRCGLCKCLGFNWQSVFGLLSPLPRHVNCHLLLLIPQKVIWSRAGQTKWLSCYERSCKSALNFSSLSSLLLFLKGMEGFMNTWTGHFTAQANFQTLKCSCINFIHFLGLVGEQSISVWRRGRFWNIRLRSMSLSSFNPRTDRKFLHSVSPPFQKWDFIPAWSQSLVPYCKIDCIPVWTQKLAPHYNIYLFPVQAQIDCPFKLLYGVLSTFCHVKTCHNACAQCSSVIFFASWIGICVWTTFSVL